MKNLYLKAGLAALVTSMYSTGASAAAADGQATAVIIDPVTVVETAIMNFGTIAPGTVGSDITVDTANTRSLTAGDATLVGGTAATSGAFNIQGAALQTVSIVIADGLTDPTGPGGALTFTPNTTGSITTGFVLTGGLDQLTVGGTLTIPAGTLAGTYSSATAYTVTVNYQ